MSMSMSRLSFVVLAIAALPSCTAIAAAITNNGGGGGGCRTDLDCSLNGVCEHITITGSGNSNSNSNSNSNLNPNSNQCKCNKPWGGANCGELQYKVTPASCKNLYNTSDPRNTWNGPIVGPDNSGTYHLFNPLYNVGSLGNPPLIMHGIAKHVEGPWDWTSKPPLCEKCGENPAALVFQNATSGNQVYSIWVGGKIWTASSLDGPFALFPNGEYPGGNPAPVYHNGSFYMTNQATTTVLTSKGLGQPWTEFAQIAHPPMPNTTQYHTEDPFLWIDAAGNWHIINHAYDNLCVRA